MKVYTLTCAYCGLPFLVSAKRMKKNKKYCSRDCARLGSIKPVVKNHRRLRVNGKRMYLHRLIYEQTTGEKLQPGEIVHHLDDNKFNNIPENLEKLDSQSAHMRRHYKEKSGAYRNDKFEEIEGHIIKW
jgi:hypothetical protein